ncbi:MAG TPA: UbiA family prenyltransferase [Terracidiphilus sp.]
MTTTIAIAGTAAAASQARPLCVDLDGTLVKSDTLLDGMCQFLRGHPLEFWKLPVWLAGGKAHLKTEVARRSPLDAVRLPYNADLVHYLQEQRRAGREIYLATGADGPLAERVAAHLGIFSGVLATDRSTNLTSHTKLERLKERFGEFDYIGNARADLPLLASAGEAMVANPTGGLRLGLRMRGIKVTQTFLDRRPLAPTLLKAIRLHQWAKNVLLFLPLALSHELTAKSIRAAITAFFCFSFMASASYLLNDVLDVENDRRHPSKRLRPFASGDLPVAGGMALAGLLVAASGALLPFLPGEFAMWLLAYIAATLSYSFYLKRIAVVDVLLLSGLYTLRMLAGAAATGTEISHWLAGFSTFLFLSLAMVKRFSELENLRERGAVSTQGRGYIVGDLEQIRVFGTSSAYAAVVVFMLYIARPDVTVLYHQAGRLWLMVPLLLYWLTRIWLLASRGELEEDPVIFAIRDRMSLLVGAGVVLTAILAM